MKFRRLGLTFWAIPARLADIPWSSARCLMAVRVSGRALP